MVFGFIQKAILNYVVPTAKYFHEGYGALVGKIIGNRSFEWDYKAALKKKMGFGSGTGSTFKADPNDFFGKYFSSIMSKVNIAQSPMTETMAMKTLEL